ncbi:Highly reducing polyketide synthase ZEA2, partial [Bienertia sinuspersici]
MLFIVLTSLILNPKEAATIANSGASPSPPKVGPKQVTKDRPIPVSGRLDNLIPWHILVGDDEIESSDSDKSYKPEGESEDDYEGSGSKGLNQDKGSLIRSLRENISQKCMEAGEGAGWTMVSDEHKRVAKAYNQADFEDTLSDKENSNPITAISFRGYNPYVFCGAYLNIKSKCDVVTSNMAETSNGYVIQAMHIIYMLEEIRGKLIQRIVSKRQEMEKTNTIVCPRIKDRLEKEKKEAAKCYVMPLSDFLFGRVVEELDRVQPLVVLDRVEAEVVVDREKAVVVFWLQEEA